MMNVYVFIWFGSQSFSTVLCLSSSCMLQFHFIYTKNVVTFTWNRDFCWQHHCSTNRKRTLIKVDVDEHHQLMVLNNSIWFWNHFRPHLSTTIKSCLSISHTITWSTSRRRENSKDRNISWNVFGLCKIDNKFKQTEHFVRWRWFY